MIEKAIITIFWIITSLLLWKFIPKEKAREAMLAFMFLQIITWLIGLAVVQWGLIRYPVRPIFPNANASSFTFDYFVYPAICALYNVHYPEDQSLGKKILYTAEYTSAVTVVEVLLEKYTQLIQYVNWNWYWTWITLYISLYISRVYVRWFFKISRKPAV